MKTPIYALDLLMTHHTDSPFRFIEFPQDPPTIKLLSLWFSLLVFFFSPDIVHAEFLDCLTLKDPLEKRPYYVIVNGIEKNPAHQSPIRERQGLRLSQ